MKFLYEILKNSDETSEQLRQEGIKPKEKYGYFYVPLTPLLEKDGQLINLWKKRYFDWIDNPVKEEVIVELHDDELLEFYAEDFAFGSIDAVYRAKDLEIILDEMHKYGKKNVKKPEKHMSPLWNGEANVKNWFDEYLCLNFTFEGTDAYIFNLSMMDYFCRHDGPVKLSSAGKGKKEQTKVKKTYEMRYKKAMHEFKMEFFDPMTFNEELVQVFNMKDAMATSMRPGDGRSLHVELSKKYNRLSFQATGPCSSEQMTGPNVILSAWSLASQNIGISVDLDTYKKADKIKNPVLAELWNGLKIPEQLPDWAKEKKYSFLIKSVLERAIEDDEFIDACKEITEILKKT